MTLQTIRLLREILNTSLDNLEQAFESKSLDFPSLDDPFDPNSPAELLAIQPEVTGTINLIISASYQLLSTVRHPYTSLSDASGLFHVPGCLRITEKLNIPEQLREAGPDGLHVDKIAAKVDLEPTKLARVLRLLATHHIFKEVKPNVFANNRISSTFDSGKSSDLLFKDPGEKYKSEGFGSAASGYVGTITEDAFKATAYLMETLEDKETGKLFRPDRAAHQKAIGIDQVWWQWIEQPENALRLQRFGACIRGSSLLWDPPETILRAFKWGSLPPGSVIVDVGGGTGSPAMTLARTHRQLKIIIQDREPVAEQGTKFFEIAYPEGLTSGQITFSVHDFFEKQPIQAPAVFFVRTICHDWPDDLLIKILGNLHAAAGKNTKLIIAEYIIPFACPKTVTAGAHADKDSIVEVDSQAPLPLLSNFGKASFNAYFIDMTMQVLLNSQERTLPHHVDILNKSGWKVVEINRIENSQFGHLVAIPIL